MTMNIEGWNRQVTPFQYDEIKRELGILLVRSMDEHVILLCKRGTVKNEI